MRRAKHRPVATATLATAASFTSPGVDGPEGVVS
jgi:hypothetical protein